MKRKFTIAIEETVTEEFEVYAKDYKEALRKAEENYKKGKFVLEPGDVQCRKIAVLNPKDNDEIEWIEF